MKKENEINKSENENSKESDNNKNEAKADSSKGPQEDKNISQKGTSEKTEIQKDKNEEIQNEIKKDSEKIKEENKQKEKDEETKKEKEEETKKLYDFYPPFLNPLDFIQYLEVDRPNGHISNEMRSFILQNHGKKSFRYEVLENSSFSQINDEISETEFSAMYLKSNHLILYSKDGILLFYSLKNQTLLKKLTLKNLKNENVNCIDITDDFSEILCGYQDGTIAVINLISEELKYTNNKVHKDCSCIELKIYKKEKNELYFISSGGDGKVFYNTLKMASLSSMFWRMSSVPIEINNATPIFMIKFINFSTENENSYKNIIKLKRYVLLGCLDFISVYCIEPIKEVFIIKKPEFIKDNIVPDASIGIGRNPEVFMRFVKKDEKNHLLLIACWGKVILFYQLPIIDGNYIESYKELGYYINLYNILRIGFMNYSVIYCIDKSFGIKILDSSKINPGEISVSNGQPLFPKKNYLAEIEKGRLGTSNILYQTKIVDSEEKTKNSYLYSIIENNDTDFSIIALGEKQLYKFQFINWETYLNNLEKKGDYLNLFSAGINIFKGKMTCLSNIPEKKMRNKVVGDFLKEKVSNYVTLNLGDKNADNNLKEDKEKVIECIKICFEFCIEINAIEYLFTSIGPLFEEKGYGELFLSKLEPFIFCDKVIDIILPNEAILNLIELYKKAGKLDILSQMLLHINIKSLDTKEIKEKLEELYLITPLIYLYMNGQNEDYFAPLEKMFELFSSKAISSSNILYDEDNNNIDYSKALTNKLITPKDILNCKEYCGHKILWYIRWCLTGKKFPDNTKKMNTDLYDKLVPKITYWLLNPKIIDEFLKFDPRNYFMFHKNIFLIEDLRKKLLNSIEDANYSTEVINTLSTSDIKINDIKPISLINYMSDWCKKKNEIKIYFYFYDFIISIFNIEKELSTNLKLESINFILKHYTEMVKHINNQEVKSMNDNLINFFEKEQQFVEEDYKEILNSINDNIFNELKLYIYDRIDYFDECLRLYLNKDFNLPGKTEKLFKWINDKLLIIKKGNYKYGKLLDTIKENILPLASLSMPKFFDLSKDIFQGYHKQIVNKLKEDKNIQLNYIELYLQYIIDTYENNENNATIEEMEEIKYILDMHIFLLCDLNQHEKIIPSLKSCPFYPLNECLKYCEKAKAYQPCLYLYLKEGSIEKAFELGNNRLKDAFNKLIKNIKEENNDSNYKDLLSEFHKYLLDIKNICENNDLNLEDIWFKILDELYKFQNEVGELLKNNDLHEEKLNNANDLHESISKDIKELLEKMCSYVSIKRILEVVSEKNKNAGFKEFRDLIIDILSSYSQLTNILDTARNFLSNLVFENEENFQALNFKGKFLNTKFCLKCLKRFSNNLNNKEKIMVFNCNHIFHKDCIIKINKEKENELICPICSKLEFVDEDKDKLSLINRKTSIITKKPEVKNKKFQIDVGALAKKTLEKLERYDEKDMEKHILMINNSIKIKKGDNLNFYT